MTKTKKIWLKAISLFLSVCLLVAYSPVSMVNVTADTDTVQSGNGDFFVPAYTTGDKNGLLKKEAVAVAGKKGYYDIVLSLKPPRSSDTIITQPTDIVLVIDKSGSMSKEDMNSIKVASNDMADKVLASGLQSAVRIAVVGFSGPNENNATATTDNSVVYQDFKNDPLQVKSFINSITTGGGTNTEAGFQKAYQLLKQSTAQQKFVVFLSDGNPTFRSSRIKEKIGSQTVYYGTGSSDDSGYNKACAMAWADALKAPVTETVSRTIGSNSNTVTITNQGLGANVFSVGYGVDTSDFASPNTAEVTYYYPASQVYQISNIFKLIQQTIVNSVSASQVVLQDIVTDNFEIVTPATEVAVTGQAVPTGQVVTIAGNTVSVPLGTITSSEADTVITVTFRIKLKDDWCMEKGTYTIPTNTEAKVTYKKEGTDCYQVFEVPTITVTISDTKYGMSKQANVTNWNDRTYDITVKSWSNIPVQPIWEDRTVYQTDGAVTPGADNVGEKYLVYRGQGDNQPVSQNPDDYVIAKVGSKTINTGGENYWVKDDVNGITRYEGNLYTMERVLILPNYQYVGHSSDFVPEDGVTYYGEETRTGWLPIIGSFSYTVHVSLLYKEDVTSVTNYFWEGHESAGAAARMTYRTVTTQIEVIPEGSTPIRSATQVVDVVDSRFDIVSTEPAGAVITGNKVVWSLSELNGTAANPGFTGKISVRAKEDFVGGNNIATNVEPQSGLIIGSQSLKAFPDQPTVNVQARVNVGDTQREIMFGQKIPNDASILADMGANLVGMEYAWTAGEGVVGGQLPANLIPDTSDSRQYTLTGTLRMQPPTQKSTANTNGYYNGNEQNNYTLTDTGIYTVLIKTGKITITKNLVDQAGRVVSAHHSNQAFLFKVYKDDSLFCEVALIPGNETSVSKTLSNLPSGQYRIVEDTRWTWRYEAVGAVENSVTVNQTRLQHDVAFTNRLVKNTWLESKDNVTNVFAIK